MRTVGEGFMEEVAFQLVLGILLSTQERDGIPGGGNRLCKGPEVQRYTCGPPVERVILGRTLLLQV